MTRGRQVASALAASVAVHLLALGATAVIRAAPSARAAPEQVDLTVLDPPPVAPPPAPQASPPTPEPPRVVKLARAVPRAPMAAEAPHVAAPPQPAPTPVADAPAASEPPLLVPGVSLSATTSGTMAVPVGRGPGGAGTGTAARAAEPRPYKARELVEPFALTQEPVFLDNVSPEEVRRFYPEDARQAKIEGVVRTRLTVDDDGSVVRVVVLADPGHGFGPAAARLARRYRFEPAKVDGRAVATEIQFTIRFELDR